MNLKSLNFKKMRSINFNKVVYIFLPFIFLFSSCKKDFGDTNVSPNGTETPPTSALLTNVLSTLGGVPSNTNQGYYVQYYSEIVYPGNSLYSQTAVSWDGFYSGALKDLSVIIDLCKNSPSIAVFSGNPNDQIQIARILRAYFFSILTDRYGDIPYTESLKGNSQIAYDNQKNIYIDLFKELKAADSSFQGTGASIKGDIVYGGDVSKWKKLANSLRLILAMRLSKVDPTWGKTEFISALNSKSGFFTKNEDNFKLVYTTAFPNPNANLTANTAFAISKTIADTLNKYNDPRSFIYGADNGAGALFGVPTGLNSGHLASFLATNKNISLAFDNNHKQTTSPIVIIPTAYIDFLRAEAALDPNYATGENSFDLFKKGLEDSWNQWDTTYDVASYLLDLNITSSVTLSDIQMQTWLALYGSTQNAWNEWRRTGVPNLLPTQDAVNLSKKIPRRFQYPAKEISLNNAAYKAAIALFPYGGDDNHDNRVWWDK
jgi:hypothetical protein